MCFRLPHSSSRTNTDRSRYGHQHHHHAPSSVVSTITSSSSSRSTARHHAPTVQPRPPSPGRRPHPSEQTAAAITNAAPRKHRQRPPQPCRRRRHHRDRAGFEPITPCQNILQEEEETAEKTPCGLVFTRRPPHHGAEEHLIRSVPTRRPREQPMGAIICCAAVVQRHQAR
jgi:hypothetical protein